MTDRPAPSPSGDAEKLKTFIAQRFLRDGSTVGDDQPLLTSGLIDSFSLIDLLHFLEDTFHVHIRDTDLTPDRMDTVRMILIHIERLGTR